MVTALQILDEDLCSDDYTDDDYSDDDDYNDYDDGNNFAKVKRFAQFLGLIYFSLNFLQSATGLLHPCDRWMVGMDASEADFTVY